MTYNKETVIGVFEQCKKIYGGDPYSWDHLISMAKEGLFSVPTLEEVWREKCVEADVKNIYSFVFEFDGTLFKTEYLTQHKEWDSPLEVTKL
jgi:hypothetical protein